MHKPPSIWNRVSDAVDAALELSVVGSFTRVGFSVRRRLDHWEEFVPDSMVGRVVVITGATSGIGFDTVRVLAELGATVEIIARNKEKAEATCAELRQVTQNPNIQFVLADAGDLDELRKVSADILKRHSAIHVLIHNAGALDEVRSTSRQGIEQTVACHVVGPFLLTNLLLPGLRAGAPSRVLWVSSGGMYSEPLSVDTLEMSQAAYHGTTAYARAKRAQVTLVELLAQQFLPDHIVVHAMHPGWADTPGVKRSLPRFRRIMGGLLRTPEQGADTLIWLAVAGGAPQKTTGLFWLD